MKRNCETEESRGRVEAAMVEKVCELQTVVNEYEHLVSDLLVMIVSGNTDMNCVLWDVPEKEDAELLLDKVREMVEARNLQRGK